MHAERVAHRGYGMLLAEIALPPAAEVDRVALERRLGDRFDVPPDRVVIYLWARAGGSDFDLAFAPRFAGEVVSSPSGLHDYYNPRAGVSIAPQRFVLGADP